MRENIRKVYGLVFLFLILSVGTAYAQTGSVVGKVTDSKGNPLESVNVILMGTSKGSATDVDGNFRIDNVKPGEYTINISATGFVTLKNKVNVSNNETTNLPVSKLSVSVERLSDVVVSAEKNRYIESIPSSSLRQLTPISKLPQNIQVVNNELLLDQQVTSIMEGVIRNVSGVTMLEHWGHFARIHMRGFRLPAFRNGFNVSDSWGPLSEDMSFVDRIEFVKGPSSFMLTAGEPGGFYNVVTKKPTASRIAQATLMAGNLGFYRASADFGGSLTDDKKLLYRFNAYYQTSDSHRGDEDVQRFGIAPSLTYNFSEKTSLNTEWNYQQAESLIGADYVFVSPSAELGSLPRDFKFRDTNYPASDIDESTIYVNFSHKFSDKWRATTQLGRLTYNQEGYSAWIDSLAENGDAFRSIFIWDALSVGNYAQAFLNGKENTGNISHTILGGFDFTDKEYYADFFTPWVETTAFNIFDPDYGRDRSNLGFDRSVDVKDRFDEPYNGFKTFALYAQDEIGLLEDKVRLTLAGRYTVLESAGSTGKDDKDKKFTPRVGLSVDIMPDLAVYGLFDQSFLAQNGVLESGHPLDPVTASDIEGGVKKSFLDGKLRVTLGAFLITKNDLALPVPGQQFSVQSGQVQSKGIEFDLQGEIFPGLSAILNYSNTNVEITEDTNPDNVGNRLAGHAKHVTNGWFTYTFDGNSKLDGFGASLGYQYQVDRASWSVGSDNDSILPDYFRLDGGLFYKTDKYRVQLNVNNILDEYLYSGADSFGVRYWQSEPGINGRLSLTYNF